MGLDTRAFMPATDEWKEQWVATCNERGWRSVMYGLMIEPVGQRNYGLAGGYLGGRAPFTIDEAPAWHQDGLEDLPWPGGLIGGMISGNGESPSFRGKAYDAYVQAVTGQSLYDPCDDPWQGNDLLHIAVQLELAAEGQVQPLQSNITSDPWDFGFDDVSSDERVALAKWFRVCADNGLAVSVDY